jgi:enoyl-CoA hydratase/carnithine racemase
MISNIAPDFYVEYRRSDMDWHFDFDVSDGVATIALNRPDKLNALTFEAYADLRDLLAQLPNRGDARVLVITGRGRGFCSGGDVEEIIGELVKRDAAELREFTRMTGAVVRRLRELPMPVIAAVNGIAAGAGSVIALAADFRLLSESASFAFLFTRVGLSGADMGSAYLLPRIIGLGRATEILMLGDKISAQRAYEIGLANQVVPDDELTSRAQDLAQRLADGPALAYSATKVALTRELDSDLGSSIEIEALTQALLMKSEDFNEFYNAWQESRKPDWRGR